MSSCEILQKAVVSLMEEEVRFRTIFISSSLGSAMITVMITNTMVFLQLVLMAPWQGGDGDDPLNQPVLPTHWPVVFFPQYDNPVMRGTVSSHLTLNILSEASEVQFILEMKVPPEHDLTHPELEPAPRNASFSLLIRKGASDLPASTPEQMPVLTCGKSRSQELEGIYIKHLMEQVLQHSSCNHGDVNIHVLNQNPKGSYLWES